MVAKETSSPVDSHLSYQIGKVAKFGSVCFNKKLLTSKVAAV